MEISLLVNHFWPDTIRKLSFDQRHLPDGIPFMGAYVELFDGATLPSEDEVRAKEADYDAYVATCVANADIKRQIAILEIQQTPRRIRESLIDPTWMDALNAQIAALRAQLV